MRVSLKNAIKNLYQWMNDLIFNITIKTHTHNVYTHTHTHYQPVQGNLCSQDNNKKILNKICFEQNIFCCSSSHRWEREYSLFQIFNNTKILYAYSHLRHAMCFKAENQESSKCIKFVTGISLFLYRVSKGLLA